MPCTVVVGAQWGDEGKGKIVDALSGDADIVARYQGGPNAGHSVIRDGRTIVLHLVPSGILMPGKRCLIGNGVVVDLGRLREEVERLEALGVDVRPRLGVSPAAHLILPYHRAIEGVAEQGAGAIGTTGRGIGFAYRDKTARVGLRVGDLADRDAFVDQVERNLARVRLEFPEAHVLRDMSGAALYDEMAPLIAWVLPMRADVSAELHRALGEGRRVLLEGAQGTLLDVDHGTYPYVTSSHTVSGGALTGAGLGPRHVTRVVGVAKAYATRVGNGPFPTELGGEMGNLIREVGDEYGATTGRPRRCGWIDAPALRYAGRVNGLDELVITKLDVLDGGDKIAIGVGYKGRRGDKAHFDPDAAWLAAAAPVYEWHEGWLQATRGVRRAQDLPEKARRYLARVSELSGVPIGLVSVGPEREATFPFRSELPLLR